MPPMKIANPKMYSANDTFASDLLPAARCTRHTNQPSKPSRFRVKSYDFEGTFCRSGVPGPGGINRIISTTSSKIAMNRESESNISASFGLHDASPVSDCSGAMEEVSRCAWGYYLFCRNWDSLSQIAPDQLWFGGQRAHKCPEASMRFIFLILFFVLFMCWIFAWAAFHIAGGLIHLLLIVALISLVVHFVSGRSAA